MAARRKNREREDPEVHIWAYCSDFAESWRGLRVRYPHPLVIGGVESTLAAGIGRGPIGANLGPPPHQAPAQEALNVNLPAASSNTGCCFHPISYKASS